jgi:hypothetical protein
MSIEEFEAEVLKLGAEDRARLAGRHLESLEQLSPEENASLWAEAAQARTQALDAGTLSSRPADAVFREARSRL